MTSHTSTPSEGALLVISAHAGDFVWRAGGAIALSHGTMGEAYVRLYPQTTGVLA
ncbi:hypothetical protein [Streptomyces sp. Qhu-G9]|uniref:hypothetical protein n=1 Tax=Streptomyces sp. Qhu-G9 TaxID=3452799 RepID=UPI0022AC89D1|nr:hypothetical protein [Streptomyces aurantiacus]